VILFLHHRYRLPGGEERAVEDLLWLVREHLGEEAELIGRDSASVASSRAVAGLLTGGLAPDQVARAVRRTGARIVHAHNLHPTFGWRSLAAAREAGARVVWHLHQYRLVCAVGVGFRAGGDCTLCHGRNTLPGLIHNCRGSRAEGAAYAASLAAWQRRSVANADCLLVPSRAALERLLAIGAPVAGARVIPHVVREFAAAPMPTPDGHALLAARLVAEKGIEVAMEACREAAVELVIAGEGPERARLERGRGGVRFVGRAGSAELAELRARASVALVPSLFAETFGLSAAEAMAAGLPVAASRIGALPEVVPEEWLSPPGDAAALARTIRRLRGSADDELGTFAVERARTLCAPEVVAPQLAAAYEAAVG
jgi:glycosyltransferase involved in cell wall biosynthesis